MPEHQFYLTHTFGSCLTFKMIDSIEVLIYSTNTVLLIGKRADFWLTVIFFLSLQNHDALKKNHIERTTFYRHCSK